MPQENRDLESKNPKEKSINARGIYLEASNHHIAYTCRKEKYKAYGRDGSVSDDLTMFNNSAVTVNF